MTTDAEKSQATPSQDRNPIREAEGAGGYGPGSLLGEVLDDPHGRPLIERALPAIVNAPLILQLRHTPPLGQIVGFGGQHLSAEDLSQLWEALGDLSARRPEPKNEPEPIHPNKNYEDEAVARGGSRRVEYPRTVELWAVLEVAIDGPDHGNPFVDVELAAEFKLGDRSFRVGGFYDGEGRYLIRFSPPEEGGWSFVTQSTARSLDGLKGQFRASPPSAGIHGPVRVADTHHFRYADGTRYRPVGTTAYAWTHQPEALQKKTLETLASTSFNKLRMCVFPPKSYLFNANEPEIYPFEQNEDGSFDWTRPVPEYFRNLEHRIGQLGQLGD